MRQEEHKIELKRVVHALRVPCLFVFLMLFVKVVEIGFDTSFVTLGVYPRDARGIFGVITSPFIHKDWTHLFGNAVPIVVLGGLFVYFNNRNYKEIGLLLFVISGFWLWTLGRPSHHIGASGIVYALAAYLVTFGFVIRNPASLAITFLVVLFYGSLIWYVLPIKEGMSWEAHLSGALCGVLLAVYYGREYKRKLLSVNGSVNFTYDTKYSDPVKFKYDYKEEVKIK